jgi:hypothetical protein
MSDLRIGDTLTSKYWDESELELIVGEVNGYWITTELQAPLYPPSSGPYSAYDYDNSRLFFRAKQDDFYFKYVPEKYCVGDTVVVEGTRDVPANHYVVVNIEDLNGRRFVTVKSNRGVYTYPTDDVDYVKVTD